ncbi:MAG: flavodoxin family protein [Treponema sp.]|nr:flavodoxin family protein [Treponema sp.]
MKLTNAFLEGILENNVNKNGIEIIEIAKKDIKPCRGCFACFEKTPGKCCISDDMQGIFQKFLEADLIIWSFPLYYFGAPSQIKAFMDRQLPVNMPFITEEKDGRPKHPSRVDLSAQRHILISTCGFFTVENNFEALVKQFDIMFAEKYVKILCPQGELFRIPQLSERTNEYLSLVKQAGLEYASGGCFSAETEKQLAEPLFEKNAFMEMANAYWRVTETGDMADKETARISSAERLLRQMSAIYSPAENAPKTEKTIEFFFTDINKTYQLKVKGEKSEFMKEPSEFAPYSVRIETPFEVWQNISLKKLDGKEALFQNKYRVLGDFSLMTSLMDGFSVRKTKIPQKKRSMVIFLMPFLAMWILLPVFGNYGAFTAILISSCVPFATRFYRLSPYDTIGAFIASALSVAFLAGVSSQIIVTVSYLVFGFLWLISLFCRVPLCAWYSSNNYDGDSAFDNPLFIFTNRIIAGVWGIMYLGVSVFTWFLMGSVYASFTGLINSIVPALAGIFTAVFSKRYPAYYSQK